MAAATYYCRGCLCRIGAGRPRPVAVESYRPGRVPFDLAAELHLKFRAVAVAYRKAKRQPGVATTDAIGHLASTNSS